MLRTAGLALLSLRVCGAAEPGELLLPVSSGSQRFKKNDFLQQRGQATKK